MREVATLQHIISMIYSKTTKVFVDDNQYKIWGFHFFNTDVRMNEFTDDMNRL